MVRGATAETPEREPCNLVVERRHLLNAAHLSAGALRDLEDHRVPGVSLERGSGEGERPRVRARFERSPRRLRCDRACARFVRFTIDELGEAIDGVLRICERGDIGTQRRVTSRRVTLRRARKPAEVRSSVVRA